MHESAYGLVTRRVRVRVRVRARARVRARVRASLVTRRVDSCLAD